MEKIFELKKDIRTPNRYIRAGERRNQKEWEEEFPNALSLGNREWFIEISDEDNSWKKDLATDVVHAIFEKNGLYSISYKEAAILAIEEYLKRTSENKNQ